MHGSECQFLVKEKLKVPEIPMFVYNTYTNFQLVNAFSMYLERKLHLQNLAKLINRLAVRKGRSVTSSQSVCTGK
jgi:hypothetical protein